MAEKPCPVDRGKLLIGLECHRADDIKCHECPYYESRGEFCSEALSVDALAYIGWLEQRVEQLEAEKPKGAWMTAASDGEEIHITCGFDIDTVDPMMLALALVRNVMMGAKKAFAPDEFSRYLHGTQNGLRRDSPFWDFSEEAEEDAGNNQ